jgi:hypothetical protein
MMIAFKPYSSNPANTSTVLSLTPWQMEEIQDEQVQEYIANGWKVVTQSEYDQYLEMCTIEQDSYEQERKNNLCDCVFGPISYVSSIDNKEIIPSTNIRTYSCKINTSSSCCTFNITRSGHEHCISLFENLENCDIQVSVRKINKDFEQIPTVYIDSVVEDQIIIAIKNRNIDNNLPVIVYLKITGVSA